MRVLITIVSAFLAVLFSFQPCEAQRSADTDFENLLIREWGELIERQPLLGIYLGEESSRLWPDNSAAAREATTLHYQKVMSELRKWPDSKLSRRNQLNKRLFLEQLDWQQRQHKLGLDLFSINQREGLHTLATLSSSIDFKSLKPYQKWVERLESLDDYFQSELAILREGIERKRVHPRVIVERIIERVEQQPELHSNPQSSPFYRPFRQAPPAIQADPAFPALQERAQAAITGKILPAYRELEAFLKGPYLEAAPEDVGLGRLPGGLEAYQFLVERYTTTELSAVEIHQLGLSEVKRIRGEMEKIKKELGFQGTLEQFFEHLRKDPKHYLKDPEELLRRYRAFCKQVDGQMPRFFATLPSKPYGVEKIPDYIAPATTTAYYLPGAGRLAGTYYVNLYRPETRALFEIPALSLHEAVPGHHHQIALAQELPLPDFRKHSAGFGDYTVFVEGWALYAESLGEEMGLYQDPYDRFGRYTYEIWRAIRLVVDTGIHAGGWSREESIDYFLQNSPRSRLDITNEIDRYIAWPGQALAYKMGEIEIQKQRRRAEKALGEAFDLGRFHDAILKEGAVPLHQLEKQVSEFIEETNMGLSKTR